MKQKDIEKLKEICEKEGFDISIESIDQGMFSIKKKHKVEYKGWDHISNYGIQLYFNLNSSIVPEFLPEEIGRKMAEHLEDYLSN